MKLTQKLVLLFLAFGLIPMGLYAIFTYSSVMKTERRVADRFINATENIADKIDRNLFERYGDVQAFGINSAVFDRGSWYKPGDNNPIVAVMNQYVKTYGLYNLTILVDLEGRVIAVNSRDAQGKPINSSRLYAKNYSRTPWFRACASGSFTRHMPYSAPGNDIADGTYIEDVLVDEDVKAAYAGADGLALGFSAPVYDKGKVVAYWSNRAMFSIVEEIFKASYQELKAAGFPDAEMTLLDNAGRIILDYDPVSAGSDELVHDFEVLMKLNLAEKGLEAAKQAVAGKAGYSYAMHARKKIDQACAYSHLKGALGYPGMNWSVLVRMPKDEARAEINAIINKILLVAAMYSG
jgi:hypothetical protein